MNKKKTFSIRAVGLILTELWVQLPSVGSFYLHFKVKTHKCCISGSKIEILHFLLLKIRKKNFRPKFFHLVFMITFQKLLEIKLT